VDRVTSRDGTRIAFDRLGEGRPVIVVGGATCDRTVTRPLAEHLARDFAVLSYDRRGWGDSGDTAPYAVMREIADLDALIAAAGGAAAVYGHSSGAGLALHSAANGLPITRLVLHDPPYSPDTEEARRAAREYAEQLTSLLDAGRRGDAVALFLSGVGLPREVLEQMRRGSAWERLEALAPTLAYDSAAMGDSQGGTMPAELARNVTAPTLVLTGGADYPWMVEVGRQLAAALLDGRRQVLEGQEHVVPPEVLAPVLREFLV
jgi:pimeloyl-ACP methyl ester carboxylesterase